MSAPASAQPLRPSWLTARPIAHRGLHDKTRGVIENSLSAARAAMAGNFAIECDVQLSRDGEAMVFHDFELQRLTGISGFVKDINARELATTALTGTHGETIPTLAQLLDLLQDTVPLIVEIKSEFDGDMRLAKRVAEIATSYKGPLAIKSFDPAVMAHLRKQRDALAITRIPLGMVAEARYDNPYWNKLPADVKPTLEHVLHWRDTQPDFLSWHVNDLPHATAYLLREAQGLPVMTWTVCTPEQNALAAKWADQIVFEGWIPQ